MPNVNIYCLTANCQACKPDNKSVCLTCIKSHYLANGKCNSLASVPAGKGVTAGVLVDCDISACSDCIANVSTCRRCMDGFSLTVDGKCRLSINLQIRAFD